MLDNGEPIVIPNPSGSRTTPSWVSYALDGEIRVGAVAKRQASTNAAHTIYSVKRLMGLRFDDDAAQSHKKNVSYEVVASDNGDAWVRAHEKDYSPAEVSSLILREMKATAESFLGEEITEAVVTVPAYFNDAQRSATTAAGKIAGLNVKRIINEPTAAALAFGFSEKDGKTIVIYDLGGGTFDVSILEISNGVFSVKATAGDTYLGGEDIDAILVSHFIEKFKSESGIDLSEDALAIQRLKEQAEKAKHELSSALETEINLPFLAADASGPKHFQYTLKRSELDIMVADIIERTLEPCRQALSDAGLQPADIDEVLLVGGQTRMPLVQRTVTEFFGREPHRGLNPDEVVAMGAAIQGAALSGEVDEVLLLDVTPLSLGVETGGGTFHKLIPRNTTVPFTASEIFTTSVDNQTFVPVHVLQGEREMAADNTSLERFELAPIPPAPRGTPEIEVIFDIDANGIVHVKAIDLRTKREQGIQVVASSGLSDEDIDRIIAEAETNKQQDVQRRKVAEIKTAAQGLLYSSERSLEEFAELIPDDVKAEVAGDIETLKELVETSEDEGLIRDALQQLELTAYKMAEAMYGEE